MELTSALYWLSISSPPPPPPLSLSLLSSLSSSHPPPLSLLIMPHFLVLSPSQIFWPPLTSRFVDRSAMGYLEHHPSLHNVHKWQYIHTASWLWVSHTFLPRAVDLYTADYVAINLPIAASQWSCRLIVIWFCQVPRVRRMFHRG